MFWAFSIVLCTLCEIMKLCCDNDMDQLYFCMISHKAWPTNGTKTDQRAQQQSSLNIPHHANLRRDCRERLHLTCVNLNCPEIFFTQYYSRNDTKMRLKPVKLCIFGDFHRGLKRQFFNGQWNPSKCLKDLKLPIVRRKVKLLC